MRAGQRGPRAVAVSLDVRLTTRDIAALTPQQARAVFDGVGRLAALTVAQGGAARRAS